LTDQSGNMGSTINKDYSDYHRFFKRKVRGKKCDVKKHEIDRAIGTE